MDSSVSLNSSSFFNELSAHRRLDWLLPDWLENYDSFHQSADEGLLVITLSTCLNAMFWLLCLIYFSTARLIDPVTFSPKFYIMPDNTPVIVISAFSAFFSKKYFLSHELNVFSCLNCRNHFQLDQLCFHGF